jgi:hypothetical protein
MDAVKPLVHSIAESGLFLDAFHRTISWGGTEALALGAAFSGHALKHLHLRVTGHYIRMEGGFMPALATALPTLESLSLSRALVHNTSEGLAACALPLLHVPCPCCMCPAPVAWS